MAMNGFWASMIGWSFAIALIVLWRLFIRCQHKWELVDKTVLPSKIEILKNNWNPNNMSMNELLKVSKVNVLIVIRCSGCGAAKVIRESNE